MGLYQEIEAHLLICLRFFPIAVSLYFSDVIQQMANICCKSHPIKYILLKGHLLETSITLSNSHQSLKTQFHPHVTASSREAINKKLCIKPTGVRNPLSNEFKPHKMKNSYRNQLQNFKNVPFADRWKTFCSVFEG